MKITPLSITFNPSTVPNPIPELPYSQDIQVIGGNNEWTTKKVIGELPPTFIMDFSRAPQGIVNLSSPSVPNIDWEGTFYLEMIDDTGKAGVMKF